MITVPILIDLAIVREATELYYANARNYPKLIQRFNEIEKALFTKTPKDGEQWMVSIHDQHPKRCKILCFYDERIEFEMDWTLPEGSTINVIANYDVNNIKLLEKIDA